MHHDAWIRPRYKDTDQMGVVYHGNYFTFFEVGRTEYMRNLGYTYRSLEAEGIILPVIECKCRYMKPITYDEPVLVRTRISELKGVRIKFEYKIIKECDGVLLAEGETQHAFVDQDMKPVRVSVVDPVFIEKLKAFMAKSS